MKGKSEALISAHREKYTDDIVALERRVSGRKEVKERMASNAEEVKRLRAMINQDKKTLNGMNICEAKLLELQQDDIAYFSFLDDCERLETKLNVAGDQLLYGLLKIHELVAPKDRVSVANKTVEYYNTFMDFEPTAQVPYAFLGAMYCAINESGKIMECEGLVNKMYVNYDHSHVRSIKKCAKSINALNSAIKIIDTEYEPNKILSFAVRIFSAFSRAKSDMEKWVRESTSLYNQVYENHPDLVKSAEPEEVFAGALHRASVWSNSQLHPRVSAERLARQTAINITKIKKYSRILKDLQSID